MRRLGVCTSIVIAALALATLPAAGEVPLNKGGQQRHPAVRPAPLPLVPAQAPGLYGLNTASPAEVFTIDPTTGAATSLVVTNGSASLVGLSFLADVLYGSDLIGYPGGTGGFDAGTIDLGSGSIGFVSDQDGSSNWHALASDETAGLLYSIDLNDASILKSLAPDGTVTSIGTGTGIAGLGMAYDDANGILYAVSSSQLFTVSTVAGTSTLVGPLGISSALIGLAYDEDNDILYANAGDLGELYTVDVSTGAATLVGPNGVGDIDGLAWIGEGDGGPPNDLCDNKVEVQCDTITAGTNIGATDEDDPDCSTGSAGASVWYSIDVPFNANVTASFCNARGGTADFDTVLDVYDGGCGALNCVAGNDDFCDGLSSEVTWAAGAGERYEIRVSGFSAGEGNFDLAVECEPLCDGVELGGPAKATVNEPFDLQITCANPDTRILVAGGRNTDGSQRFVPGCGIVSFDIGPRPNNFGAVLSDGDGNATSSQTLGDNFGNNTIYYQVVDVSKCEVSNVLEVFVNKEGEGGGTLYGATNQPPQLFTIDVTTGAGTLVGLLSDPCGFEGSTEIEYNNVSGRAFSQSPNGSFCGWEFDIADASTLGGPIPNAGAYQSIEVVDGTWYAHCFLGDCSALGELHILDPFAGTFTFIGETGLAQASGLAWDGTTMYAHTGGGRDELHTIDLGSGTATFVGFTGIVAGSLQFGPDGMLYAGGGQANAGNLYRIDPATGASTLVGPTGFAETISGLTLVE